MTDDSVPEISTIEGEVVKAEHRSDALVYGSGGGGYIKSYGHGIIGGNIKPVDISTTLVKTDVFWIRLPDGSESEIRFKGDTFNCREGHKLALGIFQDSIAIAKNVTTGATCVLFPVEKFAANIPVSEWPGGSLAMAILSVTAIFVGIIFRIPNLWWIAAIVLVLAVYCFKAGGAAHKRTSAFQEKKVAAYKKSLDTWISNYA